MRDKQDEPTRDSVRAGPPGLRPRSRPCPLQLHSCARLRMQRRTGSLRDGGPHATGGWRGFREQKAGANDSSFARGAAITTTPPLVKSARGIPSQSPSCPQGRILVIERDAVPVDLVWRTSRILRRRRKREEAMRSVCEDTRRLGGGLGERKESEERREGEEERSDLCTHRYQSAPNGQVASVRLIRRTGNRTMQR